MVTTIATVVSTPDLATPSPATRRPLQRHALVGQVIELLRNNITQNVWRVGSRIPTEKELSEQFGVSRITLRQAVQALVHVGQLQTIQGNGTFVRATSEIEAVVSRYLASEELHSVLELRQALEAHASSLAARRAQPSHLEAMRTAIAAGRTALDEQDPVASARTSVDFHRAVVDASGNAPLIALYSALEHAVLESITRTMTDATFVDGHEAILDAITRGDAEAARDLAIDHLADITSPPD